MRAKTVSLNGTVYDAKTGRPIRLERSGHGIAKNAHDVHSSAQHSKTLNRRYVERPVAKPTHVIKTTHKARNTKPNATHHSVRRFSADITPVKPSSHHSPTVATSQPQSHYSQHPVAVKVALRQQESTRAISQSAPPTPSSVLKKQAIDEATQKMTPKHKKAAFKVKKKQSTRSRRLSIASAAFAFMLFSGYLTYLYMPNLSTRVAASQAGINAEYPAYQPSGYRLAGPIAYQPGEVSMKFAANAGPATYTLTQRRSAWDSSAVLENYIQPRANKEYSTTQANGLTIYNYGTNSAWVNGGVLYTIDGDAPLSNDQVQRIAKSI